MGLSNTLRFIWDHPLVRKRRILGLGRFARWQLATRVLDAPVLFPFVNGTTILASRGMTGATGNYYVGLMEYEDMSFVLHALRRGDLFLDVGANIGSYSLCAASVGAEVVSVEPVPATADALARNVELNRLGDSVEVVPIGLGRSSGTLTFTTGSDTVNHVLGSDEDASLVNCLDIEVTTLDEVIGDRIPWLVKIDVEGYESDVVAGGMKTLHNPDLHAVIVELNGSGEEYGHSDAEVHGTLISLGLEPVSYDPTLRTLRSLDGPSNGSNTIYVRNVPEVEQRLASAPEYSVVGVKR